MNQLASNETAAVTAIKKHSISRVLALWFMLLALAPMILVAWISYQQARTSLTQAAIEELELVSHMKATYIKHFFDYRMMDIENQAEMNSNEILLAKLIKGQQQSGRSPAEYVKSYDWALQVDGLENDLTSMIRRYDYVYDLFMIDAKGNILYSVIHEFDLGSNILTGALSTTSFARAVKATLKNGQAIFSDIERYAPSNNGLFGFLTAPLLDENGNRQGVIAIQINLERIFNLMQITLETNRSMLHYLVGEDDLLRTAINNQKDQILTRKITTEQTQNWHSANYKPTMQTKDGINVMDGYIGPNGKMMIGMTHQITLPGGVHWLLISEIDREEALSSANWLGQVTMMLVLLTSILAIALAYFQAQRITRPIIHLADAMVEIVKGNFKPQLGKVENNEIGQLTQSISGLTQLLQSVQSELVEMAQASRIGDLNRRVKDDDFSGDWRVIMQGINTAQDEVLAPINAQAAVLQKMAEGQLSARITDEFRGDYSRIKDAINHLGTSIQETIAKNMQQNWLNEGIVRVGEALSGDQNKQQLAMAAISRLSDYLGTEIGAIYGIENESLQLLGSYAYSIRKNLSNRFALGESLVGQAALENKQILLQQVPDDYIKISSGLGEMTPTNILVQPFSNEGHVFGVIEIGSIKPLTATQCELLLRVSEQIGIAFRMTLSRTQLNDTLEEAQTMSMQLQNQQEELQATNEELEEQALQLKNSESKLLQQQEELQQTNEELAERGKALEMQRLETTRKNEALKAASIDLTRRAEELATASKYKSEFMANMSHELRTPLNSLLLLARVLSENKEGNLTSKQIEAAMVIHKSGNDLLTIINDILDLSKIEAGRIEVQMEMISLNELKDTMTSLYHHLAKEKGIRFEVEIDPTLNDHFRSDRHRLGQILRNLFSNAFKFTQTGGVTFSMMPVTNDIKLRRSGLDPVQTIALTVADTGIGISPDKQLTVWEAFQQADGTTSREYGGTGLGLTITRELVNLLGGEIHLISETSKGSIFSVYLPQQGIIMPSQANTPSKAMDAEHKKSLRPPIETLPHSPLVSSHINVDPEPNQIENGPIEAGEQYTLIVEDDAAFSQILADICEEKGMKCFTVTTSDEALQQIKKQMPTAVMLDLGLADGSSGLIVLTTLKDNIETRHVPVHIITGEDLDNRALEMGAVGFLTKPVTTEQLQMVWDKLERAMPNQIQDRIQNVLVVEDDADLQVAITQLLGSDKVHIHSVDCGAKALTAIKAAHYDLIVLDLGLPDMNGTEILSQLEQQLKTANQDHIPPIIVYSGRDIGREEYQLLQRYSDSIIIKGAHSEERLVEDTTLFLHRVVADMPDVQRQMLLSMHDRDDLFTDRTVLLVDDDIRNIFALSGILEGHGLTIITASDGQEALDKLAEQQNIDLVLMGIMMPVMDGLETIKRIRTQDCYRKLPIVALTAKAMKEDRDHCLQAGASDYLSKPVDVDRLISIMRVWLYR